jgi:hypothetical protein
MAGVMVKPTKYFRKQAVKAEAAARREVDEDASESLLAMARGYRSQADILKAKRQQEMKTQKDD